MSDAAFVIVILILLAALVWQRGRAYFWKQMWRLANQNAAILRADAERFEAIGRNEWPETIEDR